MEKIFLGDQPIITEKRNITESTIAKQKFKRSADYYRNKNYYRVGNNKTKVLTDEPTITELRNITDSTITGEKYFMMS